MERPAVPDQLRKAREPPEVPHDEALGLLTDGADFHRRRFKQDFQELSLQSPPEGVDQRLRDDSRSVPANRVQDAAKIELCYEDAGLLALPSGVRARCATAFRP